MKIIVLGAGGIIGQSMRLCTPEGVEPVWVKRTPWPKKSGDWWYYGLDLTVGSIDQKPKIRAAQAMIAEIQKKMLPTASPSDLAEYQMQWDSWVARIKNLQETDGKDPREMFFEAMAPDAIINLAGENRPDVVERNPRRYYPINVEIPAWLSYWCSQHNVHYVHVSTQAVFGCEPPKLPVGAVPWGTEARPPYGADSLRIPVNEYGHQKLRAEVELSAAGHTWSIVRPTFVLGVRPVPVMGRQNPMEYWMSAGAPVAEGQTVAALREVNDRYFSPSFADDVAKRLWTVAMGAPTRGPINVGLPISTTRYELAQRIRTDLEIAPVSHDDFTGLAPRAKDTTYSVHSAEPLSGPLHSWLEPLMCEYADRERLGRLQRAKELAIFLGRPLKETYNHLMRGFGKMHEDVAEDWRKANPQTDDEILEWYRTTEAYLWELSAYHVDPGFNYTGMMAGIIERLKSENVREAMCLGDGIGDLTIALGKAGIHGIYHDLKGSRTAAFAEFRQEMYLGTSDMGCTAGWEPLLPVEAGSMDAILSADFLEHLTAVDEWLAAIWDRLKPGGLFFAQSAFGMGSGPDGSMPMHLQRNDRFEKDFDPALFALGFVQLSSNWYQKPK